MKYFLLTLAAVLLPTIGFSQTAALNAVTTELALHGGLVQLSASLTYDGQPGAVAWSITVPAGWSLVSVSGPNLPAIAPPAGTGGVLEFAFTNVPTARVDFSILVRYPAGLPAATVASSAYVRANGTLRAVKVAPLEFRRAPNDSPQKN